MSIEEFCASTQRGSGPRALYLCAGHLMSEVRGPRSEVRGPEVRGSDNRTSEFVKRGRTIAFSLESLKQ